ncbi:hypothetical protein, partial [Bacteroides fragilis]|uniref:hypothetical protein n=1 Tax=Bacteroides fragilis TaxID=817 RepID=UPI001E63EB09
VNCKIGQSELFLLARHTSACIPPPPCALAQLTHARTAGEGYSVGCLGRRIGIASGNATECRFFACPTGLRLIISRLNKLQAIYL